MLTSLSDEQQDERRKSLRRTCKLKIIFKPGWRANQDAMIRDLSENGAFLIAREKMFLKTPVILYLTLDIRGKEKSFLFRGKVVRIEVKPGAKAVGHGIEFDSIDPGTLKMYQHFLNVK